MPRYTLARGSSLSGTGLHTGKPCTIDFLPAPPGTGIVFKRADIKGQPLIPASHEHVGTTVRGTNLTKGPASVFTVEHILSACSGLGIDDLIVSMDGPETPAADGSALPYVQAFLQAGTAENSGTPDFISCKRRVSYTAGDIKYAAYPHNGVSVRVIYHNSHPLVGTQDLVFSPYDNGYPAEIAPARTFGYEEEIAALTKNGLALGGSADNAIIITKDRILASGGLRFKDEFVRHKILDLLGDMYLAGGKLKDIRIEAFLGGHTHNINFLRILKNEQ